LKLIDEKSNKNLNQRVYFVLGVVFIFGFAFVVSLCKQLRKEKAPQRSLMSSEEAELFE
jgi:hypothetical protein